MQNRSFCPRAFFLVLAFAGSLISLHAQADNQGGRLAFLSAQDRIHFLRVRKQVLESQPDLKTEQQSLERERKYVHDKGADATAEDKSTLRENFLAHNEKMQAAMEQADPSVSPILDQIKAHWTARFQDKASGGNDASP